MVEPLAGVPVVQLLGQTAEVALVPLRALVVASEHRRQTGRTDESRRTETSSSISACSRAASASPSMTCAIRTPR